MGNVLRDNLSDILWIVLVAVLALVAALSLRRFANRSSERIPDLPIILRRTQTALITVVVIAALWIAMIGIESTEGRWAEVGEHILVVAMIAAVTWFACAVVVAAEGIFLARLTRASTGDDVRVRKARTQVILLRRLVTAIFILIGVASILMTFPAVRIVGQSLLASAGLISIIAGLAAQTTLTNVFAGIQLALTDSIRVGDIVEVEQESGTVGEITLTYVVIYLWDDRRLILPSSYLITTPFRNWTRWGDRITGVVMMEVDWTVPLDDLRAELERVLAESPLWDGRSFALTVSDVSAGNVTLRIATSAANASDMFGVNALVRETVVTFLAAHGGPGLPRLRREDVPDDPGPPGARGGAAGVTAG